MVVNRRRFGREERSELIARVDLELAEDAMQVRLDGFDAEEHAGGDLAIRRTGARCHLALAGGGIVLSSVATARPLYLRIPAANQLPPPPTMSRTGLVQGVGGTGARVPSIRKSPLGSSVMGTESCITPGARPQNNLARTL